ncbi:MAG TPA: amidohydrolase family protein, partial [Tepidiformaceae bacterium]|nr:amidohydrolase family protein [Tepidiformaceae bacterium]
MNRPPKTMEQRLSTPFSLAVADALTNARISLEHGFTSLRDAGGTPRGVRLAIEQGLFPGPRLRVAVTALSQTGGHGDSTMPNGSALRVPNVEVPANLVDGPEAARKTTREVLRAGADQIKIMTSGGVLSPSDEPGATGMTPEEIAAVVYEAHAAHKTVMSHAQATQGILNAVLAGVESIEHGIYLDERVVDEMVARGTFLVPTLIAPVSVLKLAEESPGSMPSWGVRKSKEVIEEHKASFRYAVERGVRIAMGTDTGVGVHGTNAGELELMVEGGMTPMQAIVATTRVAAECARLDAMTGTIEPGKRADVLAVKGDPLTHIGLLKDAESFALIMKDGQAFRNELGVGVLSPA